MGELRLGAVHNANDVKTKHFLGNLSSPGIFERRPDHLTTLFRGDSEVRRTEIIIRSRLYFDDDQGLSISCDKVQFTVASPGLIVARDDGVSEAFQVTVCQIFSESPAGSVRLPAPKPEVMSKAVPQAGSCAHLSPRSVRIQ